MSEFKENIPQAPESPSERVRRMRDELARQMAGNASRQVKVYELSKGFEKKLEEKYPDFAKYRAYHWLVGSTPPESCDKEDFEGEDSVEAFLKPFLEENPDLIP